MSYRDILVLRKEARGWRLEDMGDEPLADSPIDLLFMDGIHERDARVKSNLVYLLIKIAGTINCFLY